MEVEYRLRDKWGYVIANYSYYSSAGKENVDDYKIPGNETMLLGFPSSKANLSAWIKVGKYFGVSPSFSYIGERYGYVRVDDSTGISIAEPFKPIVLANLNVNVTNLVKGLTIGLGCYDILNSKYSFIQPYNGYHAPLPGPSRELLVKVTYEVKSQKKKRER